MTMDDDEIAVLRLQAQAWQRCVNWFALLGPLNGHDRINVNVLLEAEEANPFDGIGRNSPTR